jgi:hypothetical protein
MILESLESRQLLSVSPTSAEVSALAKPQPLQVVGSLTGTETGLLSPPGIALKATGDLGMLGPVQLQGTTLINPRTGLTLPTGSVFTLTSAQGTMTFTAKFNHGVEVLTLKRQHSGAFAGLTGTGRLVQTTVPGPIPPPPQSATVGLSLQLTLKP